MNAIPPFDAELLRRYDRPGPRYTSYPTALQFDTRFDAVAFRDVARASNENPIPRRLSLYLHLPYCQSPCFYCGCTRIITRDLSKGAIYSQRLQREIEQVAPLFDRDREVVQLHLGGGTPNFLAANQLVELIDCLGSRFRLSLSQQRDFSIELDPRHIDATGIATLAQAGFNRVSLGVQDFDPAVQQAVNRIQSVEQTLALIDACRRYGLRSVNVDLIYGLPGQTLTGFARTLDILMAERPDRLAIYSYAHLPELFKGQRQIDAADLPGSEDKLGLFTLAINKLGEAGYRYIGMDHFALPEDDLALAQMHGGLQRNFMGYTTHGDTDLIGFGMSAISHIGDSFSQNCRELPQWEAAIDAGKLPTWRGLRMDADDVLRADLIQQLMCRGAVDIKALERTYGIDFRNYFADVLDRLRQLHADGLVEIDDTGIRASERGRALLRVIAMCFDRYLAQPKTTARYSRII